MVTPRFSGILDDAQKALVDHADLDSLIGMLMQHIEATFIDKEQREAQKSIIKTMTREWLRHIYEWEKGWEVAVHINPNSRSTSDDWSNRYIID